MFCPVIIVLQSPVVVGPRAHGMSRRSGHFSVQAAPRGRAAGAGETAAAAQRRCVGQMPAAEATATAEAVAETEAAGVFAGGRGSVALECRRRVGGCRASRNHLRERRRRVGGGWANVGGGGVSDGGGGGGGGRGGSGCGSRALV